jgi:hypothetical protein
MYAELVLKQHEWIETSTGDAHRFGVALGGHGDDDRPPRSWFAPPGVPRVDTAGT